MSYIKKSHVKMFVNKNGLRVGDLALYRLNEAVEELMKKAMEKTKLRKKKTMRGEDFE